ncbi:MAG: FAD-dependent oxidoreductase [Deltaproteobacteria bacterium]|nr:FAD-dependent oxidoreductase [Deltaproteobacteria bacterium]
MERPACIDPEKIIPVARSSTLVFKTGTWASRRPLHQEKVSPCRVECPAGNNIPGALLKASEGDFDGALGAFLEESPLPGVCGRVCYHPCEGECNRSEWDGAVQIRALERAASEMGEVLPERLTDAGAGHSVAVVGSGPAGLSAAYHLARMGHPVVLVEAETELGGLLRWGIPEYRLPGQILERDLARILSLGIQVVTGARMDGAVLQGLTEAHHAVFIATGASRSRKLDIPGADLSGVRSGLDFLREIRKGQPRDLSSGKVLVIGGGNVAVDVAMSARRLGTGKVDLVALEGREGMPAHESECRDAVEEGIILHNGWGPRAVLGRNGKVAGVLFARCTSVFDAEGRFHPTYDEDTTMTLEADEVILAIGQAPDLSFAGDGRFSGLGSAAGLSVDTMTLETPIRGIYAGGDAVRYPGSVAEAIGAGKRAALAIHLATLGMPFHEFHGKVAMGSGPSFSIQALFRPRRGWDPRVVVRFRDLEPLFLRYRQRTELRRLEAGERGRGFQEIVSGLYPDEALSEAGRCFYCGTCTGCDRCYLFCPEVSILPPGEEPQTYEADPDYCKGCGVCAAVCPRGVMTMRDGR